MSTRDVAPELFAAETCGATIVRNLLRTLALKDFGTATATLDRALAHPLIKFALTSETQPLLLEDFRSWLGGADARFEYQYARLALRALQQLGVEPDPSLIELTMMRAYGAGDVEFARETALQVLREAGRKTPPPTVVRSHDMLGRIYSDHGEFEAAAKSFAAGAKAAKAAKLLYEEWDQRTNRVACLYAQNKHLEALREINAAESIARRIKRPDALAKTLLDRGNSELALGRADQAHVAFTGALAAAEAAEDPARQSDALGNLGNIAYGRGDYQTAESYHRRALAISRTLSDPASAQYDLNNLAQVFWQQGRSQEAVESLEEARRIAEQRGDQANVERYGHTLRNMYEALGKYRAAETVGKSRDASVSEEPPASPDASQQDQPEAAELQRTAELEKQVRALLNEQKVVDAQRLLEAHLNDEPTDWRVRSLYGAILSVKGDDAGARAQYERALASSPDALEPHYRMVDSYARRGELEELLGRYEKLVREEPFRAGVRLALALIYAGLGRTDDSIQQALEAVRLAPDEELPYRALAEGQLAKAHALLRTNWDGAWGAFQDLATTLFHLTESGKQQKGQWYAFAARAFEEFAMASHQANPPFLVSMDSREMEILAKAAHFYRQAQEHDAWRNCDREIARVYDAIRVMGEAEQMAIAAGHLRLDGWKHEALMLLMLSLQVDPEQAESYYQLALLMSESNDEEGRRAATDYIKRAIRMEPENQSYREAERFLQRGLGVTEEADDSTDRDE